MEEAAFPSSVIKTTSAAATRAVDVATVSDVGWLNANAGTPFVEASFPFASAAERSLFTIDDGTATDRIRLYMDASENINFETINSGDTNGASDGAAVIAVNTTFRAVGAYIDDDVIGVVDGTASAADSSAGIPVTDAATTARIGADNAGNYCFCNVAIIQYFNERKDTSFLTSITTAANDNERLIDYAANDNFISVLDLAVGQ
jgi:hypothetical protein